MFTCQYFLMIRKWFRKTDTHGKHRSIQDARCRLPGDILGMQPLSRSWGRVGVRNPTPDPRQQGYFSLRAVRIFWDLRIGCHVTSRTDRVRRRKGEAKFQRRQEALLGRTVYATISDALMSECDINAKYLLA
jgi:hypothetical protein